MLNPRDVVKKGDAVKVKVIGVAGAEHRHAGMGGLQPCRDRRRHHRVLEEAAGIAQQRGVRQLAPADADHRLGHLRRARRAVDSHRLQFFADAGVVEFQGRRARQRELHRGDDVPPGIALEQRFAIGEGAIGGGEAHERAGWAVERLHRVDAIAYLHAIGADVLDRRGADRARDQRQVLEAAQAMAQRPQHQVVPADAGIGAHDRAGAIIVADSDPLRGQRQHHARRIAGEQQVAAAAQHQRRAIIRHRLAEQVRQCAGIRHFDQQRRGCLDAEGIARIQPRVLDDAVRRGRHAGRRGAHSGGRVPRLGASLRRRNASTHSPTRAGPR